jgi:type I restriction enzyme, S subunit
LQEAAEGPERVWLGDVSEVRKGLSYKGAGLSDAGRPMVNLGNAATFGGFRREGFKYYTGVYKPRHVARGGDLLVANTDLTWKLEALGWPMLVPDDVAEALFSHHVSIIDFAPAWRHLRLPVWAYLFTREARQRVEGMAHGTTVAALPAEALTGMAVPTVAAGARVLDDAEALLRRAWAAERESEALARLRDTLLPALMSGRIRVREAERAVEDAV